MSDPRRFARSADVGQRGFTLLEALIAMTIMAIVTALAVPSFSALLSERRVSSSAQAYAAALRKAQAEASARNRTVEVLFTAADPTPATVTTASAAAAASSRRWMVRQQAPTGVTDFIEGFSLADQMPTVSIEAAPTAVGFTPLGRPVDLSAGAATPLAARMVVRFTDTATARRVCTYLTTGGAVRVCDPTKSSGHGSACQPQLAAGDC